MGKDDEDVHFCVYVCVHVCVRASILFMPSHNMCVLVYNVCQSMYVISRICVCVCVKIINHNVWDLDVFCLCVCMCVRV